MDVEFKAIQQQDKGNGVVVAATWFMPLALVPRPWDYPLTAPTTPTPTPIVTPTPAPVTTNPPTSTTESTIPNGILMPPTFPMLASTSIPIQTPSLSRSSSRSESPSRSTSSSSPPRTPTPSQVIGQREGMPEDLVMGRKKPKVALEMLEELPEGSIRIKA